MHAIGDKVSWECRPIAALHFKSKVPAVVEEVADVRARIRVCVYVERMSVLVSKWVSLNTLVGRDTFDLKVDGVDRRDFQESL